MKEVKLPQTKSEHHNYLWLADAVSLKFRLYYYSVENNRVCFMSLSPFITKKRFYMDTATFQENEIIALAQFSGYLDMNDQEIFQGDILEMWLTGDSDVDNDVNIKNEVLFINGAFGYKSDDGYFHSFASHEAIGKPKIKDAKIVGNVFNGCR